jgi:succinylglutamate desuccinylase
MLIERDPEISNVVRINADKDGPRVVFFSGVHGDEVSGVHAVEKLLFDFLVEARELRRGSLTLVRANEQALAAVCRYVKHNMNRMFREEYAPNIDRSSYEYTRTQQLKPILEDCDYFFDLHSAPIAEEPFIVMEESAVAFYKQLGISRIMTGWSKFSSGAIGGDAENYANAHGAKAATLESGSHFEKRSNDVAYRSVVSVLSLLEMIDEPKPTPEGALEIVDVYAVVVKETDDFRYAGTVDNFQFIEKGHAFAIQNGRPLTVSEDTYLLIPMRPEATRVGEEVCYLGRRIGAA